MGMQVEVIFNPGNAISDLETLATRLRNMEEPLLSIGLLLSDYMAINFDSSGKGSWPALSPSTIAEKAKRGYPLDPLVRTGEMRDAATSGEWSVSRRGSSTFVATLEVPGYSTFHFEGTNFMPARDYAFIPDDVEQDMANIIEEWLFEGIGV